MTEQNGNGPAYAKVDQPFGCEPPIIHCPICGMATIEDGEISPCQHLAFSYVGATGDFEYQSKDFKNRFSNIEMDELSFENFPEMLKTAGYGSHLLAIEISYGGMACGPVWYTDIIGFDYQTLSG